MKDPVKAEGLPETPRDTREVAKQPVDGLKRPAGTASEDAASLKKPRLSVKTSMSAADLQGQYEIRSFRDQQSASTSATTAADLRGKYEIRSFQDRGSSSRSDSRRHADYGSRERSRDSSSDHHRSERPSSGSSTREARRDDYSRSREYRSSADRGRSGRSNDAYRQDDRRYRGDDRRDRDIRSRYGSSEPRSMSRSPSAPLSNKPPQSISEKEFCQANEPPPPSKANRTRSSTPRLAGKRPYTESSYLLQYILTAIAAVSIHPLALTIVLPRAEAATALSRTKVPPIDPAAAMRHLRAVLMCSATSLAAPRSWRTRPRA